MIYQLHLNKNPEPALVITGDLSSGLSRFAVACLEPANEFVELRSGRFSFAAYVRTGGMVWAEIEMFGEPEGTA